MALAGNGRWCWLDPKLGAMHAVARLLARWLYGRDSGGGDELPELRNPEKPGDYGAVFGDRGWDCGGVHGAGYADYGGMLFYNETRGEGIYRLRWWGWWGF